MFDYAFMIQFSELCSIMLFVIHIMTIFDIYSMKTPILLWDDYLCLIWFCKYIILISFPVFCKCFLERFRVHVSIASFLHGLFRIYFMWIWFMVHAYSILWNLYSICSIYDQCVFVGICIFMIHMIYMLGFVRFSLSSKC